MSLIRSHILVCTGTGCSSSNSPKIIEAFERELKAQGMDQEARVVKTGCFGLCAMGPVVLVYPEGAFYTHVTPDDVKKDFRAPFNQTVKSVLGRVIQSIDDEIIGICARQDEVAEMVKPELKAVMDEYGMRLVNFYIEAIEVADDASRKALEEARVAKASTILEAQGERARLDTLGITWQQDKNMEVMNNLAQNEGNILATAGAGLGMGIAAGGAFGGMAANTMAQAQETSANNNGAAAPANACPSCKTQIPEGAKFCPGCGSPVAAAKFCMDCGQKLEASAKFCPNCGKKV